MLEKCVLTILELNWNQRLGNKKTKLNICHHMLASSIQLQNSIISRRSKNENVFKMSKDEKCMCKACKNTVFHCQICKFVGSLLPSSSWLLKLLISLAFIYEQLVLPNELVRVELPQWKIWEADVSSVSYKSFALTFTNSFDKIKFSCFTL